MTIRAALTAVALLAACAPSEAPPPELKVELDLELATAVLDAVLDSIMDEPEATIWVDPRLIGSVFGPIPPEHGGWSGMLDHSRWEPVESQPLREAIEAHPRLSICPYFGEMHCLSYWPLDEGLYQMIHLGAPEVLPDGRALMGVGAMIMDRGGVGDYHDGFVVLDRSGSGRWSITRTQRAGGGEIGVSNLFEGATMAAIQSALVLGESADVPPSLIAVVVETRRAHVAALRLGMTPIGDPGDALSCPPNTMRWACSLDGYERMIEIRQSAVFADRAMLEIELIRPDAEGTRGTQTLTIYLTLGVSEDGWVVEDQRHHGWN